MPYKLVEVDGGFKVRDNTGKLYSEKPISKKAALAQIRALYAADEKKEVPSTTPTGVNATGPGGLFGRMGLNGGKKKEWKVTRRASRSPDDYLIVEDPEKITTWHLPVKTNAKPDRKLMGAAWAALTGGYRGRKYAGPGKAEALTKLRAMYHSMDLETPDEASKELTVYKDADGNYRWLLFSSNAFRDREGEIVSQKALSADVEANPSGTPLRWWHVKETRLGTCDWRAVIGRTLVESGTFVNANVAQKIKTAAKGLQVSIGFLHPKEQPDANGVYDDIKVIERSLLPKGTAANPFTKVEVQKEASNG